MDNHVVIMAGGIGSRFWPMSTPECPKQFIDVMGCGRSLIQLTADRFDGVCPREDMWVVTSENTLILFGSSCRKFRKVIFWRSLVRAILRPALLLLAGRSRKTSEC